MKTIFTSVNFPIRPTTLDHKFGGKVVAIHGIAHREDKPKDRRSRDYWFFVADVEWQDGGKSERTEVEPFKLCCDEPRTNDELKCVMKAMDEYLSEHGDWNNPKAEGWFAHRKAAR
jgi:hypothetical protein